MWWGRIAVLLAVAGFGVRAEGGAVGSIFDPRGTTIGKVSETDTNLVFDTGTGEWWLNGVLQPTSGALQTNQSGRVAMRVYRFLSFDSSGITNIQVTATGAIKPGLVIVSQGDLVMASTLDLNGGGGVDGVGGVGGAGGEGSTTTNGYVSRPPPAPGGDGGTCGTYRGRGYGGGTGNEDETGGGGFGGGGGDGASSTSVHDGCGGIAYGNALLTDLFGGSGGGAKARAVNRASGGGGGGALELAARESLRMSGTIRLRGGDGNNVGGPNFSGSGGSGGGLILAGKRIDMTDGSIDVGGGDGGGGGSGGTSGGGGGGGRVAFYSNHPPRGLVDLVDGAISGEDIADNVNVSGGAGPYSAEDGMAGTFESSAGPMPYAASGGTIVSFR